MFSCVFILGFSFVYSKCVRQSSLTRSKKISDRERNKHVEHYSWFPYQVSLLLHKHILYLGIQEKCKSIHDVSANPFRRPKLSIYFLHDRIAFRSKFEHILSALLSARFAIKNTFLNNYQYNFAIKICMNV